MDSGIDTRKPMTSEALSGQAGDVLAVAIKKGAPVFLQ